MNWFTQWAMEQINTSNTMTDRGLNTQGAHKTMNVLSLGMGVQSTALYLMSALGQLPRIDFAVFSDTGREMTETIRYLEIVTLTCISRILLHGDRVVYIGKTINFSVRKRHHTTKERRLPARLLPNKKLSTDGECFAIQIRR